MKQILFCLLIASSLAAFAGKVDTLQVVTHNRQVIVTDPSKGENYYPAWGVFPSPKTDIRRVFLTVTLGCPDSIPCAHWDYLDLITIRRTGGINGKSQDYEIGRMLTPYGSIFQRGWQWSWTIDVTDFSPVLRDSVEIEYMHSGYEPNTLGWALTVKFTLVAGPPAAEFSSIKKMWKGPNRYGDRNNPIEKTLAPIPFVTDAEASIGRLRIHQTGHGMDSVSGCSEFCKRYRDVKFDGKMVNRRDVWKKCSDNPLYPQGGTWIYDRGNWCPGYLLEPDLVDVPLKPGNHTFDIDMEPFTTTDVNQPNENITAYLIQYETPRKANDVAIEKILAPNKDQNYSRQNPTCQEPRMVIRNMGSENLRSVVITYGTTGFKPRKQTWHGNLKFNETAELLVDGPIDYKQGENEFKVVLSQPNGQKDGWEGDNETTVKFDGAVPMPKDFIIQFQTNNNPADNPMVLINSYGGVVWEKKSDRLKPNTLYIDTIRLDEGCYEFSLTDTAGNGLEFWAAPEQGRGFLYFSDLEGRLLKVFESDCGAGQHFAFTATPRFAFDDSNPRYAFGLFPMRAKEKLFFDYYLNKPANIQLLISDAENKLLERHEYINRKIGVLPVTISHLPKGRYLLEIQVDGKTAQKRRFGKEE